MEKITEGYYPQDSDRDHEVAGADIAKYENESCFTGTATLSVRFRCDLDLEGQP